MPHAYRTQAADSDLRKIAFQIGVESGRPLTAEKMVDELVDRCEQLATDSPISKEQLLPNLAMAFVFYPTDVG